MVNVEVKETEQTPSTNDNSEPSVKPLDKMTKDELLAIAKDNGLNIDEKVYFCS